LSRKAIHSWSEKRGELFGDEEVETEVRKWLRQQAKYFCAAGFDALVKQIYQRWWRICREYIFFPGSNIKWFKFYIHL
jgi:hypothetical protein